MALLAPPPRPPLVAVGDDDDHARRRRLRIRMKQVLWSAVTICLTTWVCTFGIIPAIVALVVAKHVLVAILLMGMGVNASVEDKVPG